MDVVRAEVILTLDWGLGLLGGVRSVSVGVLRLGTFSSGTGTSFFVSDAFNGQEGFSDGKGQFEESIR